ncbi:hypothetical protein BN12_4110002 [Nostocoides japonicum T1-X7]|uniref:Uncharacterized protein n=1 Tax=Nostocoides japonicum T1-X7 TaxID=1194083 RepID=A0A077M570_9MICO|nr:hypothetical protein BN12_4110002 [Tetrasphaera japonica T1-X7]
MYRVEFLGTQNRASVVDKDGKVVLTDPEEPSHWLFFLEWESTHWLVHEIKIVESQ